MHVLVIEDDDAIAAFLAKGLREAGHSAVHAATVAEAQDSVDESRITEGGSFDAMIVDRMLPDGDGLSFISQLRGTGDRTPVIILSAKRSVDDRVRGLQEGGDDYMVKPFSFAELLARLHALVRRASPPPGGGSAETLELHYAGLTMNRVTRVVERDGESIDLQRREFALLEYFLLNPEMLLSKTMILNRVWGYDFDPQTNVVDVLVSRLRKKIERDKEPKLIRTIRGAGYMLRDHD